MNVGKIKARRIPLPLLEQHRIVAKIDELMALCDHLASRLKAARELSAKYATVVTETALESAAGHAAIA
jgi:type I restriction enzyme S subunit